MWVDLSEKGGVSGLGFGQHPWPFSFAPCVADQTHYDPIM